MKFIGITGGVGAGKSSILSFLKENYNCKIVLADDLAKSLMEPGTECNLRLQEEFTGFSVFTEDGDIDKRAMADLIFADPSKREVMNSIVHPAVKQAVLSMVDEEREKDELDYFFFEAALLIEDRYDELCDESWYIYTSEDNRRTRLKDNRGYSDAKIDAIFASQLTEKEFLAHCQKVIDNNGMPEEAFASVMRITEGE